MDKRATMGIGGERATMVAGMSTRKMKSCTLLQVPSTLIERSGTGARSHPDGPLQIHNEPDE